MPAFSYTSGNPSNLAAGNNASMSDIQGPFTDLRTFINGGLGTSNLASNAGILESQLATAGSGLAKGSFSVIDLASATSIANNSPTKIQFDTEDWDVSGWFDTTLARFTPQVAGVYRFNASMLWAVTMGSGTSQRLDLYKNGVQHKRFATLTLASNQNPQMQGSVLAQANGSTDFFEVFAFQNTGGAVNTSNAATDTFFQGELVGRL